MDQDILHNIRVLDFTWVLAGPYATRLLGDFGAEVIKVQPLLSAENDDDFTRGYYATWNRNKLGIMLNLDKPEGIGLAKKLVTVSDAVVENFTPHVMANFGLDYENLKKIKPDIIMVSMSTMGQQNLKSYYTGYAPTVHALSGLTGSMKIEGKPVGPGFSYADHIAGLYASMYLLEALEHRRKTGEGRHIDLSAVDLMAGLIKESNTSAEISENEIKDAAALADDPQLRSRGFFKKNNDIPFTDASPIRMERNGAAYERLAPSIGQDNAYVYGTLLGLSDREISGLKKKGVI
jgi:crotonobetainyl-CoA:carnitine CoA-transferase CaiB-like acyl-CoA transferase